MKFLRIEWKNQIYNLWAEKDGEKLWIHYEGSTWKWIPPAKVQVGSDSSASNRKEIISAPMPGRIVDIPFQKGSKVKKGEVLLVLSAMKMEYTFKAEAEGVIEDILCQSGDQVEADQVLIRMKYV
ncbi:MAG: acetyl-CoA carboxylase biotin carboxyl carrier protein subunit [Bdellovibrionales bacterium]|nr:acetyl-CoA carboxylase biotin carboxyl carrier protein subunit [Bdellovibrionales bacterium]